MTDLVIRGLTYDGERRKLIVNTPELVSGGGWGEARHVPERFIPGGGLLQPLPTWSLGGFLPSLGSGETRLSNPTSTGTSPGHLGRARVPASLTAPTASSYSTTPRPSSGPRGSLEPRDVPALVWESRRSAPDWPSQPLVFLAAVALKRAIR